MRVPTKDVLKICKYVKEAENNDETLKDIGIPNDVLIGVIANVKQAMYSDLNTNNHFRTARWTSIGDVYLEEIPDIIRACRKCYNHFTKERLSLIPTLADFECYLDEFIVDNKIYGVGTDILCFMSPVLGGDVYNFWHDRLERGLFC